MNVDTSFVTSEKNCMINRLAFLVQRDYFHLDAFWLVNFGIYIINCDSPWVNREKGERTGTRAMTRHTKHVTSLSDMCICNKQNKEWTSR